MTHNQRGVHLRAARGVKLRGGLSDDASRAETLRLLAAASAGLHKYFNNKGTRRKSVWTTFRFSPQGTRRAATRPAVTCLRTPLSFFRRDAGGRNEHDLRSLFEAVAKGCDERVYDRRG